MYEENQFIFNPDEFDFGNCSTEMIEYYKNIPVIGFSEALRLSMLDLINDKNKLYSHPVFWAPFIIVGEGSFIQ